MDVVLEVFDTFLFDRVYANLLPIHPSVSSFDPISTVAASWHSYLDSTNASSYSSSYAATGHGAFVPSNWQFQPASQFFSVQPTEFAYLSRWDRDNICRQAASFFFLTW